LIGKIMTQAQTTFEAFKTVYVFKPDTGEFDHMYQAQLDPMGKDGNGPDGTYIFSPDTATDIRPIAPPQGQVACFNKPTQVWNAVPDFRGQTFYDQTTGAPTEITTLIVPPNLALALPAAMALVKAQADQIASLVNAYNVAIQVSVPYTSKAGVVQTYQADERSQTNLAKELAVYTSKGSAPTDYFWVAADNTQVPFTLADLQGLTATMGDQGWTAFKNLQAKKTAIGNAKTVTAVLAIVW
jgi:hypothetical protein